MQNIKTDIEGNTLVIRIQLDAPTTISKSGKSRIVATTSGNKPILTPDGDTVTLGLNAYKAA